MLLGRVIGSVVATQKNETLVGAKLMIVSVIDHQMKPVGTELVAVDMVSAGAGETVLLVTGSVASRLWDTSRAVDAVIVGVVDDISIEGQRS